MVRMLARNWGWVVLRGVVAILFGLLTIFSPAISLAVLVLFFGAFALVDGVSMVVAAITKRQGEPRWGALLVSGLLGIVLGLITLLWPGITAMVLIVLIAVWALLIGISSIVVAIRLRKEIAGEWRLIVAGALAVIFGLVLLVAPGAGALGMVIVIGIYALVWGILLVTLGLRLRGWARAIDAATAPPTV